MASLPTYPVFDTDDEISSLPQKWEGWVGGLEDLISYLAIMDHSRKWSMLCFYGGEKLRNLETQLQYNKADPYGAGNDAAENHYRRLKEALTAHLAPCVKCMRAFNSDPFVRKRVTRLTPLLQGCVLRHPNADFIKNMTNKSAIRSFLAATPANCAEKLSRKIFH